MEKMHDIAKIDGARRVARALFDLENSLDQSIASLGDLISEAHKMKIECALTIFHGQESLEKAAQLASHLTEARRTAGELHRRLEQTQAQIGLRTISFGVVGKPPEPEMAAAANVTKISSAS
jgi:hypothetical protein